MNRPTNPARCFPRVQALTVCLALMAPCQASPAIAGQGELPAYQAAPDDGRGTPFVLERRDNICGVRNPLGISNPGVVNFTALISETPEGREMARKQIDSSSPRGALLLKAARQRILKACEETRSALGACSLWKRIQRRDGRSVRDLTAEVKVRLATAAASRA